MPLCWAGGVIEGVVGVDTSSSFLEGNGGLEEIRKVLAAYVCHTAQCLKDEEGLEARVVTLSSSFLTDFDYEGSCSFHSSAPPLFLEVFLQEGIIVRLSFFVPSLEPSFLPSPSQALPWVNHYLYKSSHYHFMSALQAQAPHMEQAHKILTELFRQHGLIDYFPSGFLDLILAHSVLSPLHALQNTAGGSGGEERGMTLHPSSSSLLSTLSSALTTLATHPFASSPLIIQVGSLQQQQQHGGKKNKKRRQGGTEDDEEEEETSSKRLTNSRSLALEPFSFEELQVVQLVSDVLLEGKPLSLLSGNKGRMKGRNNNITFF